MNMTCEAANHFWHLVVALSGAMAAGVSIGSLIGCRVLLVRTRDENHRTKLLLNQAIKNQLGLDEGDKAKKTPSKIQ